MKRGRAFYVALALVWTVLGPAALAQDVTGQSVAGRGGGGFGAPEISPELLAGGLVLLIGGTLILLGQRRRRHATS